MSNHGEKALLRAASDQTFARWTPPSEVIQPLFHKYSLLPVQGCGELQKLVLLLREILGRQFVFVLGLAVHAQGHGFQWPWP